MTRNCLRINHEGDSIQLSWQRGQSTPRTAPSVAFTHPFDKETLAELRWYLEDYLRWPYGIFPDNAAKIEQKFQDWGKELFEFVFRCSEKAREFFQAATYEGLDKCQLVITSDSPEVLNLPWELLYSPSDRQFIAPSLAGMSRSLSDYAVRAKMGELPQDKLNILLVIARPYGERDIGLRTIARPLLQALADIRQKVNLKVLRPPSFEQFERELSSNRGFYHIVHFDGHGDFDPDSTGFQHTLGVAGQGLLVFEKNDGSPDIVTAAQIAQNLADCRVPIFVLNACKSAQEGEENFSSVASRLVSLGAKGVVAMAYSVYAEAAKHFIGRLYRELAAGATLDSAVAAGRKDVLNKPLRPSPKGDKPLQDWLVPVLYQQEAYTPFIPTNRDTNVPDIEAFLEPTVSNLVGFPREGAYSFVGRDYDILSLERAFRQNNIVLLQGMAGVGKTELACGFAQWLEETQGRTSKIYFLSFEQGATLSNVVNQVGREVWGDKFSQYPAEQQQQAVLKYLKTQPSLLIWDNFEPVAGFPSGNEPLLNGSERESLQDFLQELRGGKSWVLITSRREERWLNCGYSLLELGGLRKQDVEELAAQILQTAGVDREKLPKEYLELLKLLGGHPLSLRVVLPHLKTQTPTQLIESLRQGLDTFQGTEEEGRDKSLSVSLDYSFHRLSERTRRHLPFLAFFCKQISASFLYCFLGNHFLAILYGDSYRAFFGENLEKADWLRILNEAVEAGILENSQQGLYEIHPSLPWYLRRWLLEYNSQTALNELENYLLIFYALSAANWRDMLVINPGKIAGLLLFEEPNLLHYFQLAKQKQNWGMAYAFLGALGTVYKLRGRESEFKVLRQQALNQIGTILTQDKAKDKGAFELWKYLQGLDATEALEGGDLSKASRIYQELLDEATRSNNAKDIATEYIQLGIVAYEQQDFDRATEYYQEALQITEAEDADNSRQYARIYHELGMIADRQHKLEEAIGYYQQALKYHEAVGDLQGAAGNYQCLGIMKFQKGELEIAIDYYQKALQIYEYAGNTQGTARVYHELGIVARIQQNFERAIDYYQKALQIAEDAGYLQTAANVYGELGHFASDQNDFESATAYYQKALQNFETVGDDYKVAMTYYNLGLLIEKQQHFEEAINYYQKAFIFFKQCQDWKKADATFMQLGQVLEAQEYWAQALPIYIGALDGYIKDNNQEQMSLAGLVAFYLGRMFKILGASKFDKIFQEVIGRECPEEIRKFIKYVSEKFISDMN
ncbi:MAG: tetratricopeptide repeat protein [Symploca sp. SIO2D2]|nr:tetratricopeptide repeat protein [Symploca sp. SIO2D2]